MSYGFYHNLPEIARSGGFKLCQDDGDSSQIDWRFIATADTHKIIKDSDFEKIDECVPFLIKSSISDLLNSKALDPVIGKIYTLSQLSLEYLLFCTRFLDKSVSSLRESLYNYQKQNLELQMIVEEKDLEISQLKKFLNRSQHSCDENYSCSKCTINFETHSLLEDHVNNIHQQQQQMKDKDTNLIKAIKLELEVKQLKEKLNLTEKELMNVNTKKVEICEKCRLNQLKTFNNIGIQINFEEKEKDDKEKEQVELENENFTKFNESMRALMSEQIENFKLQKEIDEEKHREEVEQLKTLLDNAIKSLQENEIRKNSFTPSPAPRSSMKNEAKKSSTLESENLWKIRFQELEKMYEGNQAQMAQSMKDMEQAYAEKMNKLEESLKQLKNEKQTIIVSDIKPREIVPQIYIKPHVPNDESSEEGDDEEDEEEFLVSDVKNNSIEKKESEMKSLDIQKIKKTFSAQKNLKENLSKKVDDGSTKNAKAIALFNQRMKEINLPKHSNQLTRKEVERIHTELAARREHLKKKCKKFYITRRNIKAKVDKIFTEMNIKEEHKTQTQNTISTLIDKKSPKNVITGTVYTRPEDREFQQKLERILQKKIDDKPKKKVLFDLQQKNENIRVQNEDDSDFNITSFEEDLK
ncbi:hypothetical protein PVAND_011182 [Polypedilum vanderplanki]|uniref:C2H2-type domain-containing protein n=1 Tax=Polypedilum vanderplanki TaxID=319348 RepID=A0A9J6CJM0_POLVA|nr:hypothetical protein PVAND_011182 [Polypedilum vanderplanki]